MPEDRPTSGFRSLVQQIQEKDADTPERQRPARGRLTLPRTARAETPVEPAAAAPAKPTTRPVRLLQRRWL